MAKVFTITEGLENLGALKTGGQGSVYKGKRIGEIISAVKLLPTPIISEDPSNKQYIDFRNEVMKLQRVNEEPNPNVVKILGSGITETGGFPFIEMEFIEGPDLGELLQPPHERVFTIKETIKVAEQMAHALAHCHKCDVKHGDIKSNNIKFNRHTGNYVLLDFGLAMMSDEQRRTSLRHAGAIEFMAPEQNEGKMLFQTDIYGFGVIIFELLTDQVPFPLDSNSETARNHIMLAHMESPVPDMVRLRADNLPEEWTDEKKESESHIPVWLSEMVYKCLEKKPEKRFENGEDLYDYICLNNTLTVKPGLHAGTTIMQQPDDRLVNENETLRKQLLQHQRIAEEREKEIVTLKSRQQPANTVHAQSRSGVSRAAFYGLLFMSVILASLAAYGLFFQNTSNVAASEMTVPFDSTAYKDSIDQKEEEEKASRLARQKTRENKSSETTEREKDTVDLNIPPVIDSVINDTEDSISRNRGSSRGEDSEYDQ